jgi:hypothetical protein
MMNSEVGLKLGPVRTAALICGLDSISAPIIASFLPFSEDFRCLLHGLFGDYLSWRPWA